MMDEDRFWSIIAICWPSTPEAMMLRQLALTSRLSDSDELHAIQKELLSHVTSILDTLDREDLLSFDRILEQKLYDIDRADIQAYTGGSDDGFLYCRGFIVSMGQEYYTMIQAEPWRAIMDVEFEEMCYHSYWLYEQKYGFMPVSTISRESGSNSNGWKNQDRSF